MAETAAERASGIDVMRLRGTLLPLVNLGVLLGMDTAETEEGGEDVKAEEIAGVIEDVSTISATIAAAVEEQSAATSEIARSVGGANNAASEIARTVQDAPEERMRYRRVFKGGQCVSKHCLESR